MDVAVGNGVLAMKAQPKEAAQNAECSTHGTVVQSKGKDTLVSLKDLPLRYVTTAVAPEDMALETSACNVGLSYYSPT